MLTRHPSRWTARLTVAAALTAVAAATPPALLARQVSVDLTEATPRLPPGSWHVAPTPTVTIGVVDGRPEYTLSNVVAALSWPETVVLVLSTPGTTELRYYDADGVYRLTAGGHGDGPGEFRYLTGAFRFRGDSLIALDLTQRYAVFGLDGSLGRTGRLDLEYLANPVGVLDGQHLVEFRVAEEGAHPDDPGLVVEHVSYLSVDLETAEVDEIVRLPGYHTYRANSFVMPRPFSPAAHAAVRHGTVWFGSSAEPLVHVRSFEGGPAVDVMGVWPQVGVTRADRRRYQDEVLERFLRSAPSVGRRVARSLDYPDAMPSFLALKVDSEGNGWVRAYRPPWSLGEHVWRVVSPRGEWITDVTLPPAAVGQCGGPASPLCDPLLEIGAHHLLVKHVDDLGVQRVSRYSLIKGDTGG